MALSFSRDPAPSDVEALVFAEGFDDFDSLAQDLDTEFGARLDASLADDLVADAFDTLLRDTRQRADALRAELSDSCS